MQLRVPRDNFPGFIEQIQFEDQPEITTAADGSFRTPRALERKHGEVRIEVAAEGFVPSRSAWVPVPDADVLMLPDVELKRARGLRIVTGRVVDRDGQPVRGASVSQADDGPDLTTAQAGADGRFRLYGVAGGAALVCAEAAGFRFGGTIIGGGSAPVEIRLVRLDEPPVAMLKSLSPPLARAEERALATELLEPLLTGCAGGSLGIGGPVVILALARVNPARVVTMIENRTITDSTGALIQAALGQYEDDPATAIATIEDDRDPGARAAGWLALEAFRPAAARARRENLLERALADARQTDNVRLMITFLGQIADRWLTLGSIERARLILLEGQRILTNGPGDAWAFEPEVFGEVLAVVDLPAAMALFERRRLTNIGPTDATMLDHHKGEAAVRRAGIDLASAEKLIAPPSLQFYDRPAVVLKVARKMAAADMAGARRLLATLDDPSTGAASAGPCSFRSDLA